MRSFLIFLVIVLWCLLGIWFWQLSKKCCNEDSSNLEQSSITKQEESQKVEVKEALKSGPLLFNWSDKTPILGDGWQDLRNSVMSQVTDTNHLLITGQYRKDESNNTTFENLGIARADSVRKVMFPNINLEQVQLAGSLIGEGVADRTSRFESASFSYVRNTVNVKQIADRTMIYFPYNSNQKLNAADVDSYLEEVADRVKASGERVSLTGHTDSQGDNQANEKLGLSRANIIKNVLMQKGVAADKISVASKGETSPIATNETAEGRAKNRRTELQIKN